MLVMVIVGHSQERTRNAPNNMTVDQASHLGIGPGDLEHVKLELYLADV